VLAVAETGKIAVILVADIVGYSRLAERTYVVAVSRAA
jgi:hypothetical protein